MNDAVFAESFSLLTGHNPMPWQFSLYERFAKGIERIPSCCDIPTGLGKTSVIAIWLIALARHPEKMPRRLVYVVNRRTVVDQTTDEVTKLRRNLMTKPELKPLRDHLGGLAISTLRGQFADNHEWSADPSQPAVICGTVDMIGSRLLFSGYRIGFRSKPLHAAFLGQDALLVHDEAHLEPAFQKLIEEIEAEQERERNRANSLRPALLIPNLRVMALSATMRGRETGDSASQNDDVFVLTDEDRNHAVVKQRLEAAKTLALHAIDSQDENGKSRAPAGIEKALIAKLSERVSSYGETGCSILVFVRKVEDVEKIAKQLPDNATEQLTGTLRGWERDRLVKKPVFQRFLPESNRDSEIDLPDGTIYLICTSAGEVGVNISADHLVCDLSTFDSMAQRFGRVNRFGERDDTEIHVVHPILFGKKQKSGETKTSELDERVKRTLQLLQDLDGDASPLALSELDANDRIAAFAPEPVILPVSDILFDAWSLTTIRDKMPGRPPVEPYLRGVREGELPQTEVAWREEVSVIAADLPNRYEPKDLLEDYPLKSHELLKGRSDRVFKGLAEIAKRCPKLPAWLVSAEGSVEFLMIGDLADKDRIAHQTVLLPPEAGGLRGGLLDGKAEHSKNGDYDIADNWLDDQNRSRRARIWDGVEPPEGMALIRTIDTRPDSDEFATDDEESEGNGNRRRFWHWYVRPRDADDTTRASSQPIRLEHHTRDVVERTKEIVDKLQLSDGLKEALVLGAELHDLGKRRELFQRSLGNPDPTDWHAKPGKPKNGRRWRPHRISSYRHEFGSLIDILNADHNYVERFELLSEDMRDLLLHVIAAHHGRSRPHFIGDESFDPATGASDRARELALETPRRFARLQRRYGRWGLAYLESLLRAADWAASAEPSTIEERNR